MGSTGNRFLTALAVLWICLSTLSWHAAATTSPSDFAVLQELQAYWPAPNNLPEWSGNDPCGTYWAGVTCDDSGRVISLSLASYNLKGGIPTAIGGLSSLQTLDLSFNEFGGSIPKEIGQLTQLTSLSIIQSGITGSIPSELGNCRNLTFLALNLNSLNGTIPGVIGYLNQLFWFDISQNQIGGPLPVSSSSGVGLDNLTGAQHFHFNNNSISGSIPAEIFNPPKLLHLLLDGNSLQGQIPTTVANAQKLQILRLDSNKLVGPIPAELNQIPSLQELHLNNNSLTQIPNLSALTKLQLLDLSHNAFPKQPVPSWVYSLNYAQTIALDSANLTGELNPSIFTLPALQTLSLSDNALDGSVTFTGVSPSSLALIDLQNNNFTGFQAPTMDNGINASDNPLQLAGNPLCSSSYYTGNLVCKRSDNSPSTWKASANPSCRKSCKHGATLNPNLCNCAFPLICILQLTAPSFSTVNDSSIASLSNEWADYFQLDERQVYIGYANFTQDRRLIFNLLFFPLSGNALNNSEVNNITADLTSNKYGLLEGPWLLLDNPTLPPPVGSSKSSIGVGAIVGIVVAMLVVASLIGLVVLYALRQKRRADKAEDSRPFASWGGAKGDPGEAPQLKGARWFSLAELSRATNNFDQDNEIGAGGYGKVYRAILPTGDVLAVKRAEAGSMQGATEFKNEIELLSRVHHRNLVGLVGFCYEQGEQVLVYEFMPNGTLQDHLLGHFEVPLTWEMRVAIALGSAKGLAYLHDLANPPIIHRDFKSSNVLLDEKMIAKVADFGLSKLAPDGADRKHVSTQVKGTLGYLDPEYYMTNQLSAKSDVYSFGVVLLEILSARQPIERGRYIVREVRTALNKGGMRALEPLLDPFLGDYPRKQLDAFLDLALHCVEESAASRPTMNECVKELEVIFGRSQTNSGVHITVEPQKVEDDLYGQGHYKNENDPSFQYSGTAFAPATVEPK